MDYKKLNYAMVENWCFENGQEDWLEERLDMPFMALKYEFAKEFMPEILPVAQAKPLTMKEKFAARKAAKK